MKDYEEIVFVCSFMFTKLLGSMSKGSSYRSKEMLVLALQWDLARAHCNICMNNYIYII